MLLHQNNSKEIELHFLQTIPFVSFASIRSLLICYTVSPILAVLSLHKLANANYDLCLKFVPCYIGDSHQNSWKNETNRQSMHVAQAE